MLRFMGSQRNPRADLLQNGLVGSPCSPRDSQESSPIPQFKSINSSELSPGISLEGLMLKLKLQYFGQLMQRVDSLEKTLMLGGIGGRRRKG